MEVIRDRIPAYVYNKHTTYENTVLQEHASIVSSLRDTETPEALIEAQGRLFLGICMPGGADKFIEDNYQQYYDYEYKLLGNINNIATRANMATNRAWLRLINDAFNKFIKKYRVDGSKAKMAVMDNITSDGQKIEDIDDVDVDFTDE